MELAEATPRPNEAEQSFFAQEERVLSDISGGSVFSFKRGEQWAIDPETGQATYDPKFFEDKGYTASQGLFASLHEIKCHLVETEELLTQKGGDRAWQRLKKRIETKPYLKIWENCRTDAKGNLAITHFAPSLDQDREALYRDKLFPETDLTQKPKHLQFAYAVLRSAMLPDDELKVDPEVAEALQKLRSVKGKDVISLATNPSLDPLLSLRISQKYIEPVVEDLYKKDLEDKKKEGKGKGKKGEKSEKGEGNPFEDDYKDYFDKHPEPFPDEDTDKKIKDAIKAQSDKARQEAGYEKEHGVSKADVESYYQEYRQIEGFIEPLREVFRKIVEQRKIPKRRLTALKEEGVMVDPGLIVQTHLDVKAGIESPKTMRDFEGTFVEENIPGKFSIRLVADQSGSMAGEKAIYQRRSAILVMEALREFTEMLDEERELIYPDLDVQTELRGFAVSQGTRLYKPLSKELTEKQRIEYFKGLLDTSGSFTNDYDALSDIEKDVKDRMARDPVYAEELKRGKSREIVIILSDGISSDVSQAKGRTKNLRDMGVKVVGLGMGQGADAVNNTYSPDGRICYNVGDLPKTLEDMLNEYLGSLFIGAQNE